PLTPDQPNFASYQRWLAAGEQADMHYMSRHADKRADPRKFGFRSYISFALCYGRKDRLCAKVPRVAQYARIKDYHRLLRMKAARVALRLELGAYRVLVDTAPVLERALAMRGGRGFIGKNTCFISVKHGSYLLLGEIFFNREVPAVPVVGSSLVASGRSAAGGCGSCQRCQVFCPTGALDADYRLDASKCLSYQTIENRGEIPAKYWVHLKNYYYGCDVCQIVCPYNRGKSTSQSEDLRFPTLMQIALMSQGEYEQYFGGKALTRAKRGGLMRNALIALAAIKHPKLRAIVAELQIRDDLPDHAGLRGAIASCRQ
ncbi:MAG: tRNA epoxyqueuosine(34) reductase QueG, partial [Pseudomonadota bacterium]|nr:tRNA epoxyqueuosine(34) reductase QueG [Pseudomonadota bacterium]